MTDDRRLTTVTVRPATVEDVPLILEFIKGLAEYEKLGHQLVASEERLRAALFGPKPDAEVVIAFAGAYAGALVGTLLRRQVNAVRR